MNPLPPPGLVLFQGYTARRYESLIIKDNSGCSSKYHGTVSFRLPNGEPGQQLLEIQQPSRKVFLFLANGNTVMRMEKKTHLISSPEYYAYAMNGQQMFSVDLSSGLLKTKFDVRTPLQQHIAVQRSSTKMTITCNGQPVATQHHNEWSFKSRRDHVDVTPGMDLLLTLGLIVISIDIYKEEEKAVLSTVT